MNDKTDHTLTLLMAAVKRANENPSDEAAQLLAEALLPERERLWARDEDDTAFLKLVRTVSEGLEPPDPLPDNYPQSLSDFVGYMIDAYNLEEKFDSQALFIELQQQEKEQKKPVDPMKEATSLLHKKSRQYMLRFAKVTSVKEMEQLDDKRYIRKHHRMREFINKVIAPQLEKDLHGELDLSVKRIMEAGFTARQAKELKQELRHARVLMASNGEKDITNRTKWVADLVDYSAIKAKSTKVLHGLVYWYEDKRTKPYTAVFKEENALNVWGDYMNVKMALPRARMKNLKNIKKWGAKIISRVIAPQIARQELKLNLHADELKRIGVPTTMTRNMLQHLKEAGIIFLPEGGRQKRAGQRPTWLVTSEFLEWHQNKKRKQAGPFPNHTHEMKKLYWRAKAEALYAEVERTKKPVHIGKVRQLAERRLDEILKEGGLSRSHFLLNNPVEHEPDEDGVIADL